MRCPACGEGNSDKAVVCELCQAPLRGRRSADSLGHEPGPTPAVTPPQAPAPAVTPPPGSQPPVFYIPQPSGKRGLGAFGLLLGLVVLGGGVAAAYRYWPRPAVPKAPVAIATKAPSGPATKAALPVELPSKEPPPPRVPPSAVEPASPPVQPIVEIKPSEPRGMRSVSSSWFEGADGFERAKKEQAYGNVPMIIYFRVDWCPYCRRMDQDIIDSSTVREFLANVVKVRINPESSPADEQLVHSMGVKGYPSVYVVPHPGSSPEKIHSLSRTANEPLELSAEKFISAARAAGIRQAYNQMVDGADKLKRGDSTGARADLERAIAMNPKNADAYFWRGELDAKAGDLGKAVGNYKRALELQPDRKDALFALAALYGKNREYDEAITYLTRVIRADPAYAHGLAFAQRGFGYRMKGDLPAAQADFAEACQRGTTSVCAQAQP